MTFCVFGVAAHVFSNTGMTSTECCLVLVMYSLTPYCLSRWWRCGTGSQRFDRSFVFIQYNSRTCMYQLAVIASCQSSSCNRGVKLPATILGDGVFTIRSLFWMSTTKNPRQTVATYRVRTFGIFLTFRCKLDRPIWISLAFSIWDIFGNFDGNLRGGRRAHVHESVRCCYGLNFWLFLECRMKGARRQQNYKILVLDPIIIIIIISPNSEFLIR